MQGIPVGAGGLCGPASGEGVLEAQIEEERIGAGIGPDRDGVGDPRDDLESPGEVVSPADTGIEVDAVGIEPDRFDQQVDRAAQAVDGAGAEVEAGALKTTTVTPAFQWVTSAGLTTQLTGRLAWTPKSPVPRPSDSLPVGRSSEARGATCTAVAPSVDWRATS